jgi:polyisoprenoid-binding protein YceI
MIATLPDIRSQRGLRPGRLLVDDAHSAVLFSIRHLGLSRVRGRFDRFEATLDVGPSLAETRVEATIDLASIDTNNVDRDAHLRSSDFFAVDRHPTMRFVSTAITGTGSRWQIVGDLALNDRIRPIDLDAESHGTQEIPGQNRIYAGFSATGRLRRSAFGIDFGIMPLGTDMLALGDEVEIELDLEFVEPRG